VAGDAGASVPDDDGAPNPTIAVGKGGNAGDAA
jgi:hypothetical protein